MTYIIFLHKYNDMETYKCVSLLFISDNCFPGHSKIGKPKDTTISVKRGKKKLENLFERYFYAEMKLFNSLSSGIALLNIWELFDS